MTNNISTTEFLTDPETMMSNNRRFKVGFFSPVNSTNRYAAICFNIEDSVVPWDVVWVANRNNPMKDSSGVLKISIEDGNLQLVGRQDFVFWSSNVSSSSLLKANSTTSTYAKLQGTGNLILLSHDSEVILWQSFEHLTNSLLPQTRVSIDKGVHKFDENSILQSWASASDPSDGRFRMGVSHGPFSELVTWKDDRPYWRSGPWNGNAFVGVIPGALNGIRIEKSAKEGTVEMVYTEATYKSVSVYYLLNSDGNFVYRLWDNAKQEWENRWQSIESECDSYGKCGPFGNCNPSGSPMCSCLTGFEPTNSDEWSTGNWTSGCTRKTSLQCTNTSSSGGKEEDGFFKLINVKVPDYAVFVLASNEGECRLMCLRNCSCLAYAYPKGIGCMSWIESLIDLQQFSVQAGADVFVRLDHSELGETSNKKTSKMKKSVIAIIAIVAAICTIVAFTYFLWIWLHRRRYGKQPSKATYNVGFMKENRDEFKDLPLFNFNELDVATNFFDEINKLGEGGFGPVYKGILENGQEIAVKRLSKASGQGLEEFMNEVLVISKLQHKNLVKLFGCCVEEEKLLVYEYLPNRSLDTLLFDPKYQIQLDWMTRYNIIKGICRGLLYLHRDSRMKIIHRDLKASNVLLDEEFNPKISDFGMARIFETKQDQANTERVVGTYGYMSPEYAMEGLFSEKSDIFSLGVLLLEIISGRKNSSFLQYESLSLLSYAWKLWNKNNMRSLIDPTIFEPCFEGEILKCIQLGLLCVQEIPEDRPSTTVVISMLDVKDIMDLPLPKQPGFTLMNVSSTEITQNDHEYGSIHHVTLTVLKGR